MNQTTKRQISKLQQKAGVKHWFWLLQEFVSPRVKAGRGTLESPSWEAKPRTHIGDQECARPQAEPKKYFSSLSLPWSPCTGVWIRPHPSLGYPRQSFQAGEVGCVRTWQAETPPERWEGAFPGAFRICTAVKRTGIISWTHGMCEKHPWVWATHMEFTPNWKPEVPTAHRSMFFNFLICLHKLTLQVKYLYSMLLLCGDPLYNMLLLYSLSNPSGKFQLQQQNWWISQCHSQWRTLWTGEF